MVAGGMVGSTSVTTLPLVREMCKNCDLGVMRFTQVRPNQSPLTTFLQFFTENGKARLGQIRVLTVRKQQKQFATFATFVKCGGQTQCKLYLECWLALLAAMLAATSVNCAGDPSNDRFD